MESQLDKEIKKIKKLNKKGLNTREIAEKLNITQNKVCYHLNPNYKTKINEYKRNKYSKLSKKKRRELYLKQKEYQKEYRKRRYRTDPEFRERLIKTAKEYNKNAANRN